MLHRWRGCTARPVCQQRLRSPGSCTLRYLLVGHVAPVDLGRSDGGNLLRLRCSLLKGDNGGVVDVS